MPKAQPKWKKTASNARYILTVGEMIERLQTFPKDAPVLVKDYSEGPEFLSLPKEPREVTYDESVTDACCCDGMAGVLAVICRVTRP